MNSTAKERTPAARVASRTAGRVPFSDAMRAWMAGDFEGTLDLCERVRQADARTQSDVALLRGRALLRLSRPGDAFAVVSAALTAHAATLDSSLTAKMLIAAARVRMGEREQGRAALERLLAEGADAHPTIRSEISLNIALALYQERRTDEALTALEGVDANADIVYTRALEVRAWTQVAALRYEEAKRDYRAALRHAQTCRHQDRFVAANSLYGLGILAVETLDREAWSEVERAQALVSWDASGLDLPRFWLLLLSSTVREIDGDLRGAAVAARKAEESAPSAAFAVTARARRAHLAGAAGEPIAQYDHAKAGLDLFRRVDYGACIGEERLAPMILAEQLAATGESENATELFGLYRSAGSTSRMLALTDDVRLGAAERMVDGVIAEAAGDPRSAHLGYRDALQTFRRIGYHRRAILAALRLAGASGQQYLYAYARNVARQHGVRAWLERITPPGVQMPIDEAAFVDLTPAEREIALAAARGATDKEIAAARGVSCGYVRNALSRTYAKLRVKNRRDLARLLT